MKNTVCNTDDTVDSRDVIERIKVLEAEDMRDDEEDAELEALQAFAEEGERFGDWEFGEVFIRDSHFEGYAQELAHDLGMVSRDMHWPHNHIDWEAAADALKADYTEIEFGDVTYWGRA